MMDKRNNDGKYSFAMDMEAGELTERRSTMLQFHVLKISGRLRLAAQREAEKHCVEVYKRLKSSELGSWQRCGPHTWEYIMKFTLLCVYLPYLQHDIDESTALSRKSATIKCVDYAKDLISKLSSQQSGAFDWYGRGFGDYYADLSKKILTGEYIERDLILFTSALSCS
ncbi:uncharacterized protein N7483_002477 [Penicillium malachiteum]|uniref:uncharacterized protein n=1 Tax=Penicillium malachiteum TaxID=1324776 RepID=UPI00254956CC|nr:uncharacterized protein N7483_002477 [Penicillium malachiteum]KAJ5737352.1 hypothetical protein N7483_002477 [Penicillium malachiteum]